MSRKLTAKWDVVIATEAFTALVIDVIRDGIDNEPMIFGELRMRGDDHADLTMRLYIALNQLVRDHRLTRYDRGHDLVPGYRLVNLLETLALVAEEPGTSCRTQP